MLPSAHLLRHSENQKRPNLIVYKHNADTGAPIPDTVFLVKAADVHSVDEIKTDSNGRAELKNLLPGVYEVSEKNVSAPWLQDAPAQMVTLYPNRDHTLYFKNHFKGGKNKVLTLDNLPAVILLQIFWGRSIDIFQILS